LTPEDWEEGLKNSELWLILGVFFVFLSRPPGPIAISEGSKRVSPPEARLGGVVDKNNV